MDAQVLTDIAHCFASAMTLAGQTATYTPLSGVSSSVTAFVSNLEETEATGNLRRDWIMEEADILVKVSDLAAPEDGAAIIIGTANWRIRNHVLDKTGANVCWVLRCTRDERKVF